MSTFKDELNQVTKTSEQIINENHQKIISDAENTYEFVKNKLISKAKMGEYTTLGNKKCIIYEFESSCIRDCLISEDNTIQTKKFWGRGYNISGSKTWKIGNFEKYNLYLKTLNSLAIKDNIKITPKFITIHIGKTEIINLPYTCRGEDSLFRKVQAYLRCSIEY